MTSPYQNQHTPAASTTQVPTLRSHHPIKRAASDFPSNESHATTKPEDVNCDQMVKAALTELLNDGHVKSDLRGKKSVQNLLMETERGLRSQRRESLSGGRPKGLGTGLEMRY